MVAVRAIARATSMIRGMRRRERFRVLSTAFCNEAGSSAHCSVSAAVPAEWDWSAIILLGLFSALAILAPQAEQNSESLSIVAPHCAQYINSLSIVDWWSFALLDYFPLRFIHSMVVLIGYFVDRDSFFACRYDWSPWEMAPVSSVISAVPALPPWPLSHDIVARV